MPENIPRRAVFVRWLPTVASALLTYTHVLAAAEAGRLGYGGYSFALSALAFVFFNVTGVLAIVAHGGSDA